MSLGQSVEEFASTHQLPARWLELRKICNRLVARADFWYRPDLRNEARQLAVEASDILHLALAQSDRLAPGQVSNGSEPVLPGAPGRCIEVRIHLHGGKDRIADHARFLSIFYRVACCLKIIF
jgi:hypothetical protein